MLSRLGGLTATRTASLLRVRTVNGSNFQQFSNEVNSQNQMKSTSTEKDEDMPIAIKSPYLEEKPCCILCKYNLEVNYKNTRLLSQFISSYTGLLYERNVTGLCARQHETVKQHVKVARFLNLMPRFFKDPRYKDDPKLFNPFKPLRENNV